MSEIALTIQGLHKSYTPGVPVLSDFDLELQRGEVHALIGSNGAGKSTIAKILTGLTPMNQGVMTLLGGPFEPASKEEATAKGVVMVLQELNVIPTLTVAENLFVHALPNRFGWVDQATLRADAEHALQRVGLTAIDPDSPAGSLGVGQQQLVEIAAALTQESSVLILDEPTAALTGPEIELLFGNVRRLCQNGVAVVYISHRMDEIAQIADRVTVLRDGQRIATHRVNEVETSQLVREMAGDEIAERTAPTTSSSHEVGLLIKNLMAGKAVRGVSFEARQGEILGIAGLIGSGRTELLRAIFGADRIDSGEIRVRGEVFAAKNPSEAVAAGLGLIPEDRKQDGLLLIKDVTQNATLASVTDYSRRGMLNEGPERESANRVCDRLSVKRDSLDQTVGDLSGGNQQKIVIGRWLLRDCEVLLLDEPTRGIDVAAKEAIYELLDELAASGKALVVVSSDLLELMSICHRIVVMSNGRITGEFEPQTWSQEQITAAAFAGYSEKEVAA